MSSQVSKSETESSSKKSANMPRGGKKKKHGKADSGSGRRNQPDVIVIDDDDEDSDSNSFNSQVEQLQISPGRSTNQRSSTSSTPLWGAGAKGNDSNSEKRGAMPETPSQSTPQCPPNRSGFLDFSDNQGSSLMPRSAGFAQQMAPVRPVANPLAVRLPFAGLSPSPQMMAPFVHGGIPQHHQMAPVRPVANPLAVRLPFAGRSPSPQMMAPFVHGGIPQHHQMAPVRPVANPLAVRLPFAGRSPSPQMMASFVHGRPGPLAHLHSLSPSTQFQGMQPNLLMNQGASGHAQGGASAQGKRWAPSVYSTDSEFPRARVRGGHPPGTKIVKDTQQGSIKKHHTRGGYLNKNEVNASIQECAEILIKAREHVSLERLEAMILEKYQVHHFKELNLPLKDFEHMPAAFEHSRLLCKVNSYAKSFVRARSMCTLFELGECMRDFHQDKLEFDKLGLGPLQAMPDVYELFKFPMDEYIPEITSVDIIEHLDGYLNSSNNWTNNVVLGDFLEYLVAMYQVESPFSLGVQIGSIPLAIGMLKKSKTDAGQSRRQMLDSFGHIFVEDVKKATSKFRDSILKEGPGSDCPELRVHYASLQPWDAVKEIYTKFEVLSALMQGEGSAATKNNMKQFHSSFRSFRKTLESEALIRQLFHLAVTLSVTDVQESAMAFLEEQKQPKEAAPGADTSHSGKPKKKLPSKGSIVDKVMSYINQCLQEGSLLLSHLRRIEAKLVEVFELSSFDECGQGAFLYFLLSNSKIKELLDDCGGAMLGSMSSAADKVRYYHPTFNDLKEFVCQSKLAGVTQTPHVASVVCEQFGVKEVKMLGQGSVARLCQAASTPGKHSSSQYNCHYEAALCGKACPANQNAQSVGRLGNQSREKAMAALTSCPLLDDLGEWSQWHLVFQPEHGDLRDFVVKFGGRQLMTISGGKQEAVSDFMALETAPGKLLKISSESTPDAFSQALEVDDPLLAAGHLASIVANSRGVESAPLALLANQVKAKLLSLRAQQGTVPSPGFTEREDPKVSFIITILMRLPVRICAAVADQVLLEPLNQVVGAAKSKMAVLHTCRQVAWQRERLESLGILLGIPEWAESLQAKMTFPAYLVKDVVVDELFGQTIDIEEEDEETGDEEIEDDDNICEISSDEEEKKDGTSEDSKDDDDDEGDTDEDDESEDDKKADTKAAIGLGEGAPTEEDGKPKSEKTEADASKDNEHDAETVEDDEEDDDDDDDDDDVDDDHEEETEEVAKPLTREDVCRRVVDVIRREEFGVGVELSEEAAKLMKTQQERQGRSLSRLSKDLYSKDTHFVLELIQNADDNSYHDVALPCLNFIIDTSGVTIQNNELGFEDRNIRALCDVGKSTKSKHVLGYIGQKGIGFKSVFRVTDRPEIHSNGFHICFDVNSGPMGYIMPHWIDDSAPTCSDSWQTQILLPWTDDIKGQIGTHAARFNDIRPSLLLFLHRLREITIINKVEGCEMKMSRKDLPTGEVQISHSNGMDRWLVVRKVLDASQAKSGVDVQSTEIALAFPLKNQSSTLNQGTRLGQLPVFAFLPLQSYGFRFIVQGDFNVPSSREAVDKSSCWNQWLRDRIPALFFQAWDSFLSLPDMSPLQAFIHFLQFIPLEGEVMGFFSPVTSQIRSMLMAKDCMPVVSPSGNKDDIMWKPPSKTVMTERCLVRDIISPRLLLQNLGLYYLHWDVLEALDPGTLRALGVGAVGTDHLLQIGQGITSRWDCQGSPDQVIELAKWLACVYSSLDSFKDNADIFSRLAKMRLIPLSDGRLVSTEDVTVFLLTNDGHDVSHGKSRKSRYSHDQALRQDVNIIHPSLTSTPDPEVNSQVTKLLSRMDIKEMNPHDLFHDHILPVLKSDAWKEKSKDVLIGYLVCAKEVLFDSGEDLAPLKDVARVVTTQGSIRHPVLENVHFPMEYGNAAVDLVNIFPSVPWTLLSPDYLPPRPSKAEQESWHSFFHQLGVRDFLCINKIDVSLDSISLSNSPWADYKEMWQDLPQQFIIEDFACEEFQLLTAGESVASFERMRRLYELLDKMWDEGYSKSLLLAKVKDESGAVLKTNIETSFAIHLKSQPWVPATWVTMTTNSKLEREHDLLRPSNLYCDIPEVQRLLAHTVKYLAVKTPSKSSFTRFLQIKHCVQKEAVKEALISWGQRSEGKDNMPVVFSTSVDHIVAVYEFLQLEFPAGDIQTLFHDHPVIFIASCDRRVNSGSSTPLPGHMMRREEVWWTDDCRLFSKYRDSLEKYNNTLAKFEFLLPFYHGRKELFRIARIDRTHNMMHLAQLLKHITSVFTLEDEGVLPDVMALISAIGQALSKADETQAGVRTQEAQVALELRGKVRAYLSDACVFPTKAMKLVGLKDSPMIADSKEWEKMFETKPNVHFLLLELPQSPSKRHHTPGRPGFGGQTASSAVDPECVQYFLDLFEDIQPLSSNVDWTEITSGFKPYALGQKYLHDILGVLQQFLYYSFPDVYAEFKANSAGQLKDLLFTEVDRLEVRYELKKRPDVFELRTENCIIKDNHFYFLSKNIGNQAEINREVARYFGNNDEECVREIRSFLSQAVPILEGKCSETLSDLLARQRTPIEELPEEEERWEVPLPTVINPSFVPPAPSDVEQQGYVVYDRQDSATPFQPPGGQQNSSGDSGGEIKSWPPRSLPEYEANPLVARPGGKKTVSKFTPPEAPDYIKATKQIPAYFRFVNDPEGSRSDVNDGEERGRGEEVTSGGKGSGDGAVGLTGGEGGKGGSSGGGGGGRGGGGGTTSGGNQERGAARGDGGEQRYVVDRAGNVVERAPRESVDTIRKELDPRGDGVDGTESERQVSVEEDGNIGQSRGKRKLLSESASSEEGESQTPASKRQSLETKDDQNLATDGDAQPTIPFVESGDNGQRAAGGVQAMTPPHPHNRGQGLVAVPRLMPGSGPVEGGAVVDRDNRRLYRPSVSGGKMLQFNIPTWGHQPDKLAYTELTPQIPNVKPNFDLGENADTDQIGRWGETLVYDYLRQHMASNDTVEDVIWANSEEEKGLPYDFEMILRTESQDGGDGNNEAYSVFIEVKATRTDDKALFEISANQVEFAFGCGERFQIFRVFGAGKDSMRLVRIDNIADRMKNKSVRLLMVI